MNRDWDDYEDLNDYKNNIQSYRDMGFSDDAIEGMLDNFPQRNRNVYDNKSQRDFDSEIAWNEYYDTNESRIRGIIKESIKRVLRETQSKDYEDEWRKIEHAIYDLNKSGKRDPFLRRRLVKMWNYLANGDYDLYDKFCNNPKMIYDKPDTYITRI